MTNLNNMLSNLSPLLTTGCIILILYSVGRQIFQTGMSGKKAIESILWYTVLIALCSKPILLVNLGLMFVRIVTNLLGMLGFGGLEGGI
jgi:hypothetical protein